MELNAVKGFKLFNTPLHREEFHTSLILDPSNASLCRGKVQEMDSGRAWELLGQYPFFWIHRSKT